MEVLTMAEKTEKLTPAQQIAALEAQKQKILETAKAEAMSKVEAALAELNDLGFKYRLTEEMARTGNHTPSDKACSVCGYKTNPPHDARSHRGIEPKKPFTDGELAERHLTKV